MPLRWRANQSSTPARLTESATEVLLWRSIYLTEQKGRIRKEMNQYSNDQGSCLTDALLNYETVRFQQRLVKPPQRLPLTDHHKG